MNLPIPDFVKFELKIEETSPSGLVWKINKGPRAKKESKAGCLNKTNGYYYVRLNDKLYLAHRLIWFLAFEEDPGNSQIDHKDRNRANNKISNLRKASQTQQNHNQITKNNNKCGFKGVRQHTSGLWHAYITINGKQKSLKYFKTKEEAARAYDKAAKEHFGEFARLNFPESHST